MDLARLRSQSCRCPVIPSQLDFSQPQLIRTLRAEKHGVQGQRGLVGTAAVWLCRAEMLSETSPLQREGRAPAPRVLSARLFLHSPVLSGGRDGAASPHAHPGRGRYPSTDPFLALCNEEHQQSPVDPAWSCWRFCREGSIQGYLQFLLPGTGQGDKLTHMGTLGLLTPLFRAFPSQGSVPSGCPPDRKQVGGKMGAGTTIFTPHCPLLRWLAGD